MVRPAVPADADGIAAVHVTSWRESYSGVLPEHFFDADALSARERMWTAVLDADPLPGALVVAERSGGIVGFAFAGSADHPDARKGVEPARDLHLFAIYLLADAQHSGIGRDLLNGAIGDRPAQLWVARSNERGRAFYGRHGFVADGVEVADPDLDGLVEIRMVR